MFIPKITNPIVVGSNINDPEELPDNEFKKKKKI